MTETNSIKQEIIDWLELHEYQLNIRQKGVLKRVCENLDFDLMRIEERNNGENIVIIPISGSIIPLLVSSSDYLRIDKRSVLDLMIIQSHEGKFRWSSMISYFPDDATGPTKRSENTIQNIVNGGEVADNGIYKFINLKGDLLYQIDYKNRKLDSFGALVPKAQETQNTPDKTSKCYDWYLKTWYYSSEGDASTTEEYLFSKSIRELTGVDGDLNTWSGFTMIPEEPIDQTIIISGTSVVYETELGPDDYLLPGETDN